MAAILADLRGLTPLAETNAYADPQAVYTRLRAEWGEVAPIELEPGINAWLVMGHEELVHVVRHERLFSKDSTIWTPYAEGRIREESPLRTFVYPRPNVFFTDGEEHRKYRTPLEDAIGSLRLRQVSHHVRDLCSDLISAFSERGSADLLMEYCLTIPAVVVGRLLGMDLETARTMHGTLLEMFMFDAKAGNEKFEKILMNLVWARASEPAKDMTSVIVHHQNISSPEDAMHSMVMLISAAAEGTMTWIAGALLLMLTDPRFAGRMRGGRLDIDDALDEVLWRNPPFSNLLGRYVTRDTELGGQALRQGDAVVMSFAAANADPRVHAADPWEELGNRAHVSWSAGPHVCPAQIPARLIVREAVEAALNQLPGLRLSVPPDEVGRLGSPWSSVPATLPVEFTPVPAKTRA
ncbi:MAG: cytochrome P450 [Streptosporangiales bacterium]|jgi:cytochrome P450|nr:cytochrome P450 [Streptosporangiales bacterium]